MRESGRGSRAYVTPSSWLCVYFTNLQLQLRDVVEGGSSRKIDYGKSCHGARAVGRGSGVHMLVVVVGGGDGGFSAGAGAGGVKV